MAIALIPARSGSKGIPGKNFKPLAGLTPVDRAVTCCFAAGIQPWVSSDIPAISAWPFWLLRPEVLGQDDTPMKKVVEDFLARVPGEPNEIILLVQPTQPLREPKHLRQAVDLMKTFPQVTSVVETESINKSYTRTYGEGFLLPLGIPIERRQDARPTYRVDGTVYAFRRQNFYLDSFHFQRGAYGLVIPPEESAPLDTPLDWQIAELRLKARHAETHTRPDTENSL